MTTEGTRIRLDASIIVMHSDDYDHLIKAIHLLRRAGHETEAMALSQSMKVIGDTMMYTRNSQVRLSVEEYFDQRLRHRVASALKEFIAIEKKEIEP